MNGDKTFTSTDANLAEFYSPGPVIVVPKDFQLLWRAVSV
jgi:hypothetical protein